MSLQKIRTLMARAENAEPRTARQLLTEADEVAMDSRIEVVVGRRGTGVLIGVGQDGRMDVAFGKRTVTVPAREVQPRTDGAGGGVISDSIRRQDASGNAGAPLAVCLDGTVVDLVPDGADYTSPETIAALRGAAAAELGLPVERFEILLARHLHPESSAVDCLDCEPGEGS